MTVERIIFLHGYASLGGLKDAKARLFHERFSPFSHITFDAIDFNPTPQDFQYHSITGMIDRLRQFILERNIEQLNLIGISQGANVALNYAHRFGNVTRLLLLSPELFYDSYSTEEELMKWEEVVDQPMFHYGFRQMIPLNYGHHRDGLRYTVSPAPRAPMTLIHGIHDEAIPIERSRHYAAQFPTQVRLVEADSSHLLNDQDELIWQETCKLFEL